MGIGTRIYASNGNACDVTIPEILRYLGEDEGTRVIVTYVEGLRDAATFLAGGPRGRCQKTGAGHEGRPHRRRRPGRRLAHRRIGQRGYRHRPDLQKSRHPTFRDEGELIQAAAAFATQPDPRGNRVGIITNTGGPAVIATDVLVGAGLKCPPSRRPPNRLKDELYPEASVNNPVDVLATGNAAHYRACMEAMMADDSLRQRLCQLCHPLFRGHRQHRQGNRGSGPAPGQNRSSAT
jgi:acyl-CoA synthetase (NDP forming)